MKRVDNTFTLKQLEDQIARTQGRSMKEHLTICDAYGVQDRDPMDQLRAEVQELENALSEYYVDRLGGTRNALVSELGDVINCLVAVCLHNGIGLDEIVQNNNEKMLERMPLSPYSYLVPKVDQGSDSYTVHHFELAEEEEEEEEETQPAPAAVPDTDGNPRVFRRLYTGPKQKPLSHHILPDMVDVYMSPVGSFRVRHLARIPRGSVEQFLPLLHTSGSPDATP